MAINFPSSPTEGQILNVVPGNSFIFKDGFWQPAPLKTALPKNYVVNPCMTVSQENGDAGSVAASSLAYYPADTWIASAGLEASARVLAVRSRPSATGSDYIIFQNNVAYTTPEPAPEYAQIVHYLEGQRCADFGWGTANGKQGIFRFAYYTNLGGTYSVQIKRTSTGIPTFLAPFTAATGAWQVFEFAVPPPPADGAWLVDNTAAIQLSFGLHAASVFANGNAGWQAVNKVTMVGTDNGLRAPASHLVTDVGFYLDPYLTGVAPSFVAPTYAEELRRCQRYWYRGYQFNGPVVAPNQMRGTNRHHVPMRATPAVSIRGAPQVYELAVTSPISSTANACNAMSIDLHHSIAENDLTAGRAGVNYYNGPAHYIAVDARL